MSTVIKYIRFPFAYSVEKLTEELNALTAQWVSHFNTNDYTGDWGALPLRSINGALNSIIPEHKSDVEFRDTILMQQCPYIKSVLDYFPCEHKAVRLLKLSAGAIIKEHRDRGLRFEDGEARIHVPITTNPQLEFYLDNERVDMKPGECWYMNFDLPHRINNHGDTDRVHLVFDIIVNDKIRELLENTGPAKKKIIDEKEAFSTDDKIKMIQHLKAMNTPVSLQLAEKMEAEIAN